MAGLRLAYAAAKKKRRLSAPAFFVTSSFGTPGRRRRRRHFGSPSPGSRQLSVLEMKGMLRRHALGGDELGMVTAQKLSVDGTSFRVHPLAALSMGRTRACRVYKKHPAGIEVKLPGTYQRNGRTPCRGMLWTSPRQRAGSATKRTRECPVGSPVWCGTLLHSSLAK